MLVIKTRLARQDIIESAKFIADDNPEAARRFLIATEETFKLIKTTPNAGSPERIANQDNLRKWLVKGFTKYAVYYSTLNNEIKIVRVLHTARDYKRVLFEK